MADEFALEDEVAVREVDKEKITIVSVDNVLGILSFFGSHHLASGFRK